MNMNKLIEDYVSHTDWRVKENANTDYSVSGLQAHLAEAAIKSYILNDVYPKNIKKSYDEGYIHIHDLGFGNSVYCLGHDLEYLLIHGFNGVGGKVAAYPAKHLRTVINQMVNFLFTLQNESAGANAFNNIDTLLAPYIRIDKLSYKEVKQCVQEFIYSMNIPTRIALQSPFSNVTFDIKCPEHMKEKHPVVGGEKQDFTYGELDKEIGMITQAFFEIMMDGDAEGKPFTFPIPTINLHKDFVWDDAVAKVIFEATAKYGIPNFQNFLNSDLKPEDSYSMCCRLRLDKRKLEKMTGGIFGAGTRTGSIGVVTINLPRLAYEATNEKEFFVALKAQMDIAKESLEIKRQVITENLDKGLMPYIKRYVEHFDNHFSTIGLIGGNECALNLFGYNLQTPDGREFINRVLEFMKNVVEDYQEETGNLYNLEQTPAESTSFKLAQRDKSIHPKIITAGVEGNEYYTNSTHLPVNHTLTMMQNLKIQDRFNAHYNGGTIVHNFLGQRVTDWINCMVLVRRIAETTKLPFFTITPTFSICPVHGYISGEHAYCPLEHTVEDMEKYGTYLETEE